jgi:hypothetical protein
VLCGQQQRAARREAARRMLKFVVDSGSCPCKQDPHTPKWG